MPDRERDARIEQLLILGLDHYFAGRYELAINVWSRVLFLDRGHARARAYIERARGAVAEQHREGDELFHAGAAALTRGDRPAARRLLTSAVQSGARGEDALALLHRLDRLDAAAAGVPAQPAAPARPNELLPAQVEPSREARMAWLVVGVLAGILIAAGTGAYLWMVDDPFDLTLRHTPVPAAAPDPLPVPAPCELRLLRARDLVAKDRLHDALAALEPGDPDERHRASFDALRAAIQRELLDGLPAAAAPDAVSSSGAPPRR